MAACPLRLAAGAAASLRYGPRFGAEKLQLLEVDAAMLEEIVASGVVIKGGRDEEAVLCTATKTYALKQVETSNTLLLVPPPVRARGKAMLRAAMACAARAAWLLRVGRRC
jgi:sister chromatid cohesion protein DCC1